MVWQTRLTLMAAASAVANYPVSPPAACYVRVKPWVSMNQPPKAPRKGR